MEILIAKIKSELLEVVNRNVLNNFCSKKGKEFLLSNAQRKWMPVLKSNCSLLLLACQQWDLLKVSKLCKNVGL